MPRCKNCGQQFERDESWDFSPASELGDIFVESAGDVDPRELCPDCREELGIVSLLGFDA